MDDFLKKVPLFAEMPEDDLERLCQMTNEIRLAPGEVLFDEGSQGDRAYVIKEGQIEIVKRSGDREVLIAVREEPGEVIGEMSMVERSPRMATVRARTDARLLEIHHEQLEKLLNASPSASRAILQIVLTRWRNNEAKMQQSEKMARLGTLTAGVAHELNNPAAAVKRGADQLLEALGQYERAHSALQGLALAAPQRETVARLVARAQQVAARPPLMDPLERSDREYELESWLDERNVADGWELAPRLVNLDFSAAKLAELVDSFGRRDLPAIIGWLSASYNVYSLLNEIGEGSGRISAIVKALKSYSYLDQGPVQIVNVHEGLDNTVIMLRHKLAGINIRRDYAPNLPSIQAYGSELNQVWTNLIDNAADALAGKGQLTIRTWSEEDDVVVEIEDNGPGIPPAAQSKLFDPFFTTKGPGKGTGLGLNISYNIVVEKHRGDISARSTPGCTVFQVRLPRQLGTP
jgi:signal transduction histidine kinase